MIHDRAHTAALKLMCNQVECESITFRLIGASNQFSNRQLDRQDYDVASLPW